MAKSWSITQEVRHNAVQYTIRWSPWGSMDRWIINRIVPSEAGLFQIWTIQGSGLELLTTETTYFGGLRNSLREVIDHMAPAGNRLRTLIDGHESWFRFSSSSSRIYLDDMRDWFSTSKEGKLINANEQEIFVYEEDSSQKFPLPPPDIQINERNRAREAGFGPPLPNKSSTDQ